MEMQQIIEQAEQNIRQALKDYGRHTDQTQVLYDIPAINTYQAIGPKVGNALGREFGLDLSSKNDVLPTALGAGVETNPWQIAQAYQVFANGGVMNE